MHLVEKQHILILDLCQGFLSDPGKEKELT